MSLGFETNVLTDVAPCVSFLGKRKKRRGGKLLGLLLFARAVVQS